MELQGRSIGIVGYGELGKAVANVAESFGMKVLISKRDASDSRKDRIALHELLPLVDVLSLHCPLNKNTQGLIGSDELAMMKSSSLLINTARGGLVDEIALLDALKTHQLAGAGLDVLEQEPPAIDNVLIDAKLKNLLITPHVAWASRECRQRLVEALVHNIEAFIEGKPRNVITHP